jgi:hypothetical protein
MLGQAGNRGDAQIRELATVAASFSPELIVLKDMEGYLRGREQNEVASLLRDVLREHGLADSRLPMRSTDLDAARHALEWARIRRRAGFTGACAQGQGRGAATPGDFGQQWLVGG